MRDNSYAFHKFYYQVFPLLFLLTMSSTVIQAASSQPIAIGKLTNGGGKCLDVSGSELHNNGGKVQIWECNDSPNQQWFLDSDSRLVNAGGKCLEISGVDLAINGGKVQIWSCNSTSNQKWQIDSKNRLLNAGGKCLDVAGNELRNNGGKVQSWVCNESANQQWKFSQQSIYNDVLVNGGGKCLDVAGDELHNNGGKVQIWNCNTAPNQKWLLDTQSRLVNGGGKCLDVAGDELHNNGGKVQIWECNDSPNQKWRLNGASHQLRNDGGKCLDVNGDELRNNGGKVQIWDCNTSPNQKWLLGFVPNSALPAFWSGEDISFTVSPDLAWVNDLSINVKFDGVIAVGSRCSVPYGGSTTITVSDVKISGNSISYYISPTPLRDGFSPDFKITGSAVSPTQAEVKVTWTDHNYNCDSDMSITRIYTAFPR